LDLAKDLVVRKLGIEGKSYLDIRVQGAEGIEKTILNALAVWRKMPEGDRGKKETEEEKKEQEEQEEKEEQKEEPTPNIEKLRQKMGDALMDKVAKKKAEKR